MYSKPKIKRCCMWIPHPEGPHMPMVHRNGYRCGTAPNDRAFAHTPMAAYMMWLHKQDAETFEAGLYMIREHARCVIHRMSFDRMIAERAARVDTVIENQYRTEALTELSMSHHGTTAAMIMDGIKRRQDSFGRWQTITEPRSKPWWKFW